jgi:hypothetical protein
MRLDDPRDSVAHSPTANIRSQRKQSKSSPVASSAISELIEPQGQKEQDKDEEYAQCDATLDVPTETNTKSSSCGSRHDKRSPGHSEPTESSQRRRQIPVTWNDTISPTSIRPSIFNKLNSTPQSQVNFNTNLPDGYPINGEHFYCMIPPIDFRKAPRYVQFLEWKEKLLVKLNAS